MTAATVPAMRLDEHTRDELIPQCESQEKDGNAATHAAHWTNECEHTSTVSLHCKTCSDRLRLGVALRFRWVCTMCAAPTSLARVEAL